jgi:hypothetical protein
MVEGVRQGRLKDRGHSEGCRVRTDLNVTSHAMNVPCWNISNDLEYLAIYEILIHHRIYVFPLSSMSMYINI